MLQAYRLRHPRRIAVSDLFATLRFRLILLILLSALPAFVLVFTSGLGERRRLEEAAHEQAVQMVSIVSSREDRLVQDTRQMLSLLAHLAEAQHVNGAGCHTYYSSLLSLYPYYSNLGTILPDGTPACSAVPLEREVNLSDRLYFRRVLEDRRFAVGAYQVGRETGRPSINFAYPVLNPDQSLRSVIYAALDLRWFSELGSDLDLPPGAVLTVVDDEATVLARFPDPEQWLGQSVLDLPLYNELGERPSRATTVTQGLDGVKRLYAFGTLYEGAGGGQVYVSVGLPVAAAFADVEATILRDLLLLLLTVGVAVGGAWAGGDVLIVRKVRALLAAIRRVRLGDLTARLPIPPTSTGELDQIGLAFNEMTGALQRLRQLQQLVLDSAGQGIYGVDREGMGTFVNPLGAQLVGYEAQDLLGNRIHDLVHHSRADGTAYPHEQCPIYDSLRDGVTHRSMDEVFWRRDGTSFPVEYVSSPIIRDGVIAGAVIVFTDITERLLAEEEARREGQFRRFLSPQVADVVASRGASLLTSHRREIAVVFCDLRGFTEFSEGAQPEDLMSVLQEYYDVLGEHVFRFEGTIGFFAGDGIMVFFNDPLPCPDPAVRAVHMALAIRDSMTALTERWQRHGYILGCGAGIAMGYATLGAVGNGQRTDYTAIGSVVNLASRLCGEARDGEVLITQRVRSQAGDIFDTSDAGSFSLKGFPRPVPAFLVGVAPVMPLTAA